MALLCLCSTCLGSNPCHEDLNTQPIGTNRGLAPIIPTMDRPLGQDKGTSGACFLLQLYAATCRATKYLSA